MGFFAGAALRPRLLETDRLVLGLDGQVGLLWASLGVPLAARVNERVWIFTEPSVGLRNTGLFDLPLGVALHVHDRVDLSVQADYAITPPLMKLGYVESGLGVSVGLSVSP